jgi:hypothetical protein
MYEREDVGFTTQLIPEPNSLIPEIPEPHYRFCARLLKQERRELNYRARASELSPLFSYII